jgi:predicted MPP superfamily phosphohydrolase
VYLAGHTHGGQICGPGGLALTWNDSMARRYCKGVHRYRDTWLVVSRGMGFSQLPLRLFCPPEAIEIRLRSAHSLSHL